MNCKQLILIILVSTLLLSVSYAENQTTEIERISREIEETHTDSVRARLYLELSKIHYNVNNDKSLSYALKAERLAKSTSKLELLGSTYYVLSNIYDVKGNRKLALDYALKGIKIFEKLKNEEKIADGYSEISVQYYNLGAFEKAIVHYKKVLSIYTQLRDKKGEALALNNIGSCFVNLNDFKNAKLYFKASLKIEESLGMKDGMAEIWINLGTIDFNEGRYKEGLLEFEKALPIFDELNILDSKGICLLNMGLMHYNLKQYTKARSSFEEAIRIFTEIGHLEYLSISYYNHSLNLTAMGDHKKAYEFYTKKIAIDDSLSNKYLTDQITEMTEKYESEKKQKEILLLTKEKKNAYQKNKIQELENLNQKAELSKSNTIVYFSIGGLVLLMAFAFMLIKRIRLKSVIFRQLKQQKDEILFAKQIIEAKNKDILDSILYAKKIQDAILHEENKALKNLDQHFVIFQPKDIVSGDFYWTLEKTDCVYAAVADCTGHGVPGAFMSMLGIAFLNEITKSGEMKSPAEILNELRTKVIRELGQSGNIGENKDGMDISLVKIDKKKNVLEFAGAHNPLLISRRNEIIQLNADKQPIGYQQEQKPFTNQILELQQGDMMYLLSDGYADQFGGEPSETGKVKGKKFKMTRFKELACKISHVETEIQKSKIEKAFFDWKGDMEQIDDVCVMGIKI